MKLSTYMTTTVGLLLLLCGAALLLRMGVADTSLLAQTGTPPRQAEPAKAPYKEMPVDPYERNAALWASQRAGATSGSQRGQELYYMKCWICHSEYVIAADPSPAPSLRDVAKRLTDEQITSYIRNGTSRMPAYRYQLTEADISDLLAAFKEKCGTFPPGHGCFDEHNPPPNPLYRFERSQK